MHANTLFLSRLFFINLDTFAPKYKYLRLTLLLNKSKVCLFESMVVFLPLSMSLIHFIHIFSMYVYMYDSITKHIRTVKKTINTLVIQ